jgi:hypothetical protein
MVRTHNCRAPERPTLPEAAAGAIKTLAYVLGAVALGVTIAALDVTAAALATTALTP